MDHLGKFNNTMKELLRDLLQVFPDDTDFQMVQMGITTALMADEKLIQEKFNVEVSKFEAQILAKDENFFINKSFEEYQNQGVADQLISKLKKYWTQLDTHNREMVWKYLKVLILLNRKIVASA